MVFLDKPDGGVRPVGLLCLVLRLWSRLRQPCCQAWGKRGPTTRARGRAGPAISWEASAERSVSRVGLSW
eukprot:1228735-Pyramimonas_sp.AAC.1